MILCNKNEVQTQGTALENFNELTILITTFLVNLQNVDENYTKEYLFHDLSINIDECYDIVKEQFKGV